MYYDKDNVLRTHNTWYGDSSTFIRAAAPWFTRGGACNYGLIAGQFFFYNMGNGNGSTVGSRLVLAPNN